MNDPSKTFDGCTIEKSFSAKACTKCGYFGPSLIKNCPSFNGMDGYYQNKNGIFQNKEILCRQCHDELLTNLETTSNKGK